MLKRRIKRHKCETAKISNKRLEFQTSPLRFRLVFVAGLGFADAVLSLPVQDFLQFFLLPANAITSQHLNTFQILHMLRRLNNTELRKEEVHCGGDLWVPSFPIWPCKGETTALTFHTSPWASSAELLGIQRSSPLTSARPNKTQQQTTTCQQIAVQMCHVPTRSAGNELW